MSDHNPFAEFDPNNNVGESDAVAKLNKELGRKALTQIAVQLLKAAYPHQAKAITYTSVRSATDEGSILHKARKIVDGIVEDAYDMADRHTGGHGLTIATWLNAKKAELKKALNL